MAKPTTINLNDATPAPPAGKTNVKWQASAFRTLPDGQDVRDVSAYVLLPASKAAELHKFLVSYDAATGLFVAQQPHMLDLAGFPGDPELFLDGTGNFNKPATGSGGGTLGEPQVPAGTIDGVNPVFTLPDAPNPSTSLLLFKNGVLQTAGVDFNLAGNTITYVDGGQLVVGDSHIAYYSTGGAGGGTAAATVSPDPLVAITESKAYLAACILDDHRVMFLGGYSGGTYQLTCYIYDKRADVLTRVADLPTAAGWGYNTVLHNGKVYFFGHGAATVKVMIYDPDADTWSYGALLPINHSGGRTFSVSVGAFAGQWLLIGAATTYAYNPATDTFSTAATTGGFPGFDNNDACLLQDGRILTAGGATTAQAWVLDPATMLWTRVADMPGSRWQHRMFTHPSGHAVEWCGYGGNQGGYRYNPATNTWQSFDLRKWPARDAFCLAFFPDGTLLVAFGLAGGTNDKGIDRIILPPQS